MEKAHSRIKWENYPSIATPLNETNLNKMDIALDEVDNRVLGLDTAKLDKAVANSMVKEIDFDEATGIFTITSLDGTTKTVDTKLEKVATNFSYDYETQKLKLTLLDGTEQEIDMSTLISQYEFADTSTIGFTVGNEGKITAIVKDGSITEDKLQPNFLADIKVEVAKGKSYSDSSYENATTSSNASKEAKQYRDEAKQFRDEAQAVVDVDIATTEKAGLVKPDGATIRVDEDGTIHADAGTVDYTELENKPSINGVELDGDKTLDSLGIASKTKVENLETELAKTTYKVDTVIANVDLGIKETASGEEIHLTDSAEGKAVEFALYGKAKQNTTTGKNLLPNNATTKTVNGVTFTINEDKSVSVSGTASARIDFVLYDDSIDASQFNEKYLSGCVGGNYNTYFIRISDVSIASGDNTNGSNKIANLTNSGSIRVAIVIQSGVTVNTTFYPMISAEGGEYEPYTNGASPNTQFPQSIEVSGESGSVEVKSVGKNFFNPENTVIGCYFNNAYVNTDSWRMTVVRVKPNSDITLSGFTKISGAYSAYLNSNDYMDFNRQAWNVNSNNGTHTIPSDIEWIAICYAKADIGANLQVEEGNATPYEPYKETLSTIQTPNGLAGIKVSSGGNYTDQNGQQWICDEVVKYADGSGERVPRVKKIRLKSTDDWMVANSNNIIWFYTIKLASDFKVLNTIQNDRHTTKGICTHFGYKESLALSDNNSISIWQRLNDNSYRVGVISYNITTIEDFKTFLDENEVYLYYPIAEPITTPLTAEEIAEISTFYPITNISNDFDCGMKVKYNADSKNYIDKMVAEKVASIVANMNN